MIDDRCRIERYLEIEYAGERNWRLTIGTFETNGRLSVESVFPIILSDNKCDINMGFTPQTQQAIEQRKAHAASDAAMNNSKMGGHWIIMDLESKVKTQNTLCHKRWDNNTIKGAEAIVALELITVIGKKGKMINEGKITVAIDNKRCVME